MGNGLMKLKWAHFCSGAEFDRGIWHLTDVADAFYVGHDGFLALGRTYLALYFEEHANEPASRVLQVRVLDAMGRPHP